MRIGTDFERGTAVANNDGPFFYYNGNVLRNMPTFDPQMFQQAGLEPKQSLIGPNPDGGLTTAEQFFVTGPIAVTTEEPTQDGYKPQGLEELVRTTPADLITRTVRELQVKPDIHNGHAIDPIPEEMAWMNGMGLRSEVLYTAIKDIVHLELERFARRIEQHYILTPRKNEMEVSPPVR